jgi:DDE superfamily endonuclease
MLLLRQPDAGELRYFCSFSGISTNHGEPYPFSCYLVTEEALRVIDNGVSLQFPHTDPDRLRLISEGFDRGKSPLSSCAGALDGISIRIREPSANAVANPVPYFHRKGMFALCVQAVCDYNYRFTFASALCPGSTYDSVAFAASSFSTFLQKTPEVGLPHEYWIATDEAYCCSDRILTPWPGRALQIEKDCFNFWLSSARIVIEQSFGMLVGRWGMFWQPLRCNIVKASRIAMVCVKLHNFFIDRESLAVPEPSVDSVDLGDRRGDVEEEYPL